MFYIIFFLISIATVISDECSKAPDLTSPKCLFAATAGGTFFEVDIPSFKTRILKYSQPPTGVQALASDRLNRIMYGIDYYGRLFSIDPCTKQFESRKFYGIDPQIYYKWGLAYDAKNMLLYVTGFNLTGLSFNSLFTLDVKNNFKKSPVLDHNLFWFDSLLFGKNYEKLYGYGIERYTPNWTTSIVTAHEWGFYSYDVKTKQIESFSKNDGFFSSLDWVDPYNKNNKHLYGVANGNIYHINLCDGSVNKIGEHQRYFNESGQIQKIEGLVQGISVFPGSCDNICPVCPCWNDEIINNKTKYCATDCCDLGVEFHTNIDNHVWRYELKEQSRTCVIKKDEQIIKESSQLNHAQFNDCERKFSKITQLSECTISDTISAMKIYNTLLRVYDTSSPLLIFVFFMFIIMVVAFIIVCVILFMRQCNKLCGAVNKGGYKTVLVQDTTTSATSGNELI